MERITAARSAAEEEEEAAIVTDGRFPKEPERVRLNGFSEAEAGT
jgi:hypothetical protein